MQLKHFLTTDVFSVSPGVELENLPSESDLGKHILRQIDVTSVSNIFPRELMSFKSVSVW